MTAPAVIVDLTDTKKLQARIAAAVTDRRGAFVQLPRSMADLDIRAPIRVPAHTRGLRLAGQSRHATTLHWGGASDGDGAPTTALFDCPNTADLHVSDLGVSVEAPLGCVARHRAVPFAGTTNTHAAWARVFVEGRGRVVNGFEHVVDAEAGGRDENNEHGRYAAVELHGVTGAGWVFGHRQSKRHTLRDCACDAARAIVDASGGGTFTAEGTHGGRSTYADFVLGQPNDYTLIRDSDLEGSARFVVGVWGPSAVASPVRLLDNRWDGNGLVRDGGQAGEMVVVINCGPLEVRGGVLANGYDARDPAAPIPRITHWCSGDFATVVCGVDFAALGSAREFPVRTRMDGTAAPPQAYRLTATGNTYRDAVGQSVIPPGFERDAFVARGGPVPAGWA